MAQMTFSSAVEVWVSETKERSETVFKESAQRIVSEMQTEGPSVATTKKAIAKAQGLPGRGRKASRMGPIQNPGGAGALPVDTGFLRASLTASLAGMPTIREDARPEAGKRYEYSEAAIALVINGAELGQTLYFGYVAAYARHQHYGANGKPGRQWVTLAAQRWTQIVADVTAEAKTASA